MSQRRGERVHRVDFLKGHEDDDTSVDEQSYLETYEERSNRSGFSAITRNSELSRLFNSQRRDIEYSRVEDHNYEDGLREPLIRRSVDEDIFKLGQVGEDHFSSHRTHGDLRKQINELYAGGEEGVMKSIVEYGNKLNFKSSKHDYRNDIGIDIDMEKRSGGIADMNQFIIDSQLSYELDYYDGWESSAAKSIVTNASEKASKLTSQSGLSYNDVPSGITYGRRIAEFLSAYKWYNPNNFAEEEQDEELHLEDVENERGDLTKGWEFFEHITLPRYRVTAEDISDEDMEKATPGEKGKTSLYSVWKTDKSQLGDFGVAIGTYFHSVYWLALISFVAGVTNIPNIMYFWGSDYDPSQEHRELPILQQGSAICGDTEWVPCPGCNEDDWIDDDAGDRFAVGVNEVTESALKFALKTNCDGARYSSFGVIVFLFVGLNMMSALQEEEEVKFDESIQSAPDYAIVINDPPDIPETKDPDKWRDFLETVAKEELPDESQYQTHVTFITLAKDNSRFMQDLIYIRINLRKLRKIFNCPQGDVDYIKEKLRDEPRLSFFQKIFNECPHDLWENYKVSKKLLEEITEQRKDEVKVTNVFAIFETERAQRAVLQALTVGSLSLTLNRDICTDKPVTKFCDEYILDVSEPDEPATIRWLDLASPSWKRMLGVAVSTILTIAFVILGAFLVIRIRSVSPTLVAPGIAVLNIITPPICRYIVGYEIHPDEGDRSLSLYTKMTLFRWANTALILSMVVPFTHSLGSHDDDLLPQVTQVFFAEILSSPLTCVADFGGHFNRHFIAPRAKTQGEVNACFGGAEYELAERYTTVTKLVFLCFFFSTLYPVGFFVCAIALTITYFVDKFCLFRVWRKMPPLGNEIADFSRKYLYTVMLVALVIVSAYQFAGFPYDNLCDTHEMAGNDYVGTFTLYTGGSKNYGDDAHAVQVTIANNTSSFNFCNMNCMYKFDRDSFPPSSSMNQDKNGDSRWMTETQENIVDLIGFYGLGLLIVVAAYRVFDVIKERIGEFFVGSYEPSGKVNGQSFSEANTGAYVPQIAHPDFNYPLIVCDIRHIPPVNVGWEGPNGEKDHDFYNIVNRNIPAEIKDDAKKIVSVVKYYCPHPHPPDENVVLPLMRSDWKGKR